jgi:hypothetical protein
MSDKSDLTIHTCNRCGQHKVGESPFEADRPIGFYIDLLKVTGAKYPHHAKTPGQVFFCTKECMIDGLQYGISGMIQETVPIGLTPQQLSPWR